MQALLAAVVAVLAAIGTVASVAYFHHDLFNPRFAEFPWITRLHVVLGGLYLALAPCQILTGSRGVRLGYHRRAGQVLLAAALVVGASALFITLVIPGGGWLERILVAPFAVFFLWALVQGARQARARRVVAHREWMLRAFAIGSGIATQRLLFVVLLAVLIGRKPTGEEIVLLMSVSFTAAFLLHSIIVEWWIRVSRSSQADRWVADHHDARASPLRQ